MEPAVRVHAAVVPGTSNPGRTGLGQSSESQGRTLQSALLRPLPKRVANSKSSPWRGFMNRKNPARVSEGRKPSQSCKWSAGYWIYGGNRYSSAQKPTRYGNETAGRSPRNSTWIAPKRSVRSAGSADGCGCPKGLLAPTEITRTSDLTFIRTPRLP